MYLELGKLFGEELNHFVNRFFCKIRICPRPKYLPKYLEILKCKFTSISFQLLRRAQKPMHQSKTRKIKLILPKKRLRRLLRLRLKQNLVHLVTNLLQTLRHQLKNRPKFYQIVTTLQANSSMICIRIPTNSHKENFKN